MSSKNPSSDTESDSKIVITNDKIVRFYNKNKQLDIEKINLLYIELFENIMSASFENPSIVNHIMLSLNNQSNELNNVMSIIKSSSDNYKSELSNIKEVNSLSINNIKSEMEQIRTSISSLTNLLMTKLYETKDIYIKDIKELLKNSENNSILSLGSTIEKYNNMLTEKIIVNINDIIPKTQSKQYDDLLNLFKRDMLASLNEIKGNDPKLLADKLSIIIETKYNNLLSTIQENMTNNISQSEIRLTNNLNNLKELSTKNSVIQESINDELTKYINKSKTIMGKGSQSENILLNILNDEYTSAEIINTSNEKGKGDVVIKRKDKMPILIETKNYSTNVKKDEVDKFIRDVTNCDYNGIFLSQNSGVVGKDNYQIDIHNKNILIYIHNVKYDISKINLAINTIDLLYEKLFSTNDKNASIPMDVLRDINTEYQTFIHQKDKLVSSLKDYYKKTLDQYSDLSLPSLEKFISGYYANTKKNLINCEICKKYETDNLKSLARHKQSCKKKNIIIDDSNALNIREENSITEENNITEDNLSSKFIDELNNDELNNNELNNDELSNDDIKEIIENLKRSDESTVNKILNQIEELNKSLSSEEQVNNIKKPRKYNKKQKNKKNEIEV